MPDTNYERLIHPDPEFPVIFHIDTLSQDKYFMPHWHESIELLFFREGRAVVECDAVGCEAEPGDLMIVNSGELHSVRASTPRCVYDCLILGRRFLEGFDLPVSERTLSPRVRDGEVASYFDRIRREMEERLDYYKIAVKAQALMLSSHLFRTAARQNPPEKDRSGQRLSMVRAALLYIREHYTEGITIDQISRHVGFSKYYLCRAFREVTGRTILEAIHFLQCGQAKELLSGGRCNVSEAAEQCGFHNLSYFARVYKRQTGELPSDTVRGR